MTSEFIGAVEDGEYQRAIALLEGGADPNSMIDEDLPVIIFVASNDDGYVPGDEEFGLVVELVERLGEAGAGLDVEDYEENGLLNKCFHALMPMSVVSGLISKGAPLANSKGDFNKGSLSGIMYALEESDGPDYALSALSVVGENFPKGLTPERLGRMLVDYFIHGQNDLSNFEYEFVGKYIPVASALLELGADVDARSTSGHTALMRASMNCLPNVAVFLLSKGADANLQSHEGNTALMFVCGLLSEVSDEGDVWECTGNHLAIAKSLLEAGARKDMLNSNGLAAASLAKEYKSLEIEELLG